jgi:hypothetical protein
VLGEQARCYFASTTPAIGLAQGAGTKGHVMKTGTAPGTAQTAAAPVPMHGALLVSTRGCRPRDPEDRVVEPSDREGVREKMFDKTVADSFPASDPPSSIPDPEEDSF